MHVRRNIKLAEAPSYGKTIFEYEPRCNGAQDYKTACEYIHSQTGAKVKEQALRHSSGQAEVIEVGEEEVRLHTEADISKQPSIGIQEIPPEKKVTTNVGDDVVEQA